jgi:hypothetical protein
VVELWSFNIFFIDTTSVIFFKSGCGLDATRNWPILIKFCLHLLCSGKIVPFRYIVLFVIDSPALILTSFSNWAWWPSAVFADVDWLAKVFIIVVSRILFAG